MLQRTEAIVIKTFPYGEADLLVTFLTLDFGLRKAFAKSPRKTKSRFGSSLEPFTHSRISLMGREDAELPRLTQCDIIRPFQSLREDYGSLVLLSGMAELTLHFLREGARSEKAFLLLKEVLHMMEGGCSALCAALYRIRFLALKGYLPRLSGCAVCGGEGRAFYASQGSVLCAPCAARRKRAGEEAQAAVSPGSARLYEALCTWELRKAPRLKVTGAMLAELNAVLDCHVEYLLSKPLKTRAFASDIAASP